MARCPYGIGCGGKRCRGCLKDVDLNSTVVFYSEKPDDFRLPKGVNITKCSGSG
jgi:hypothetical protein